MLDPKERGNKERARNGELQIGGGKIKEVVSVGEKETGRRVWERILSPIEPLSPLIASSLLLWEKCIIRGMRICFFLSESLFEITFASTLETSAEVRVVLHLKCPSFLPDFISNCKVSTRYSRIFQY